MLSTVHWRDVPNCVGRRYLCYPVGAADNVLSRVPFTKVTAVKNTQERNFNADLKMRLGAADPPSRPRLVKWKTTLGRSRDVPLQESPSRFEIPDARRGLTYERNFWGQDPNILIQVKKRRRPQRAKYGNVTKRQLATRAKNAVCSACCSSHARAVVGDGFNGHTGLSARLMSGVSIRSRSSTKKPQQHHDALAKVPVRDLPVRPLPCVVGGAPKLDASEVLKAIDMHQLAHAGRLPLQQSADGALR